MNENFEYKIATKEDIDAIVQFLAKDYYETSRALANLLTSMDYYGFDDSYINNFEKQVDGMTVNKANEIAKKYFPKENLQFVIVGKSSEIKDLVKNSQ